jgi:hypothetical protein
MNKKILLLNTRFLLFAFIMLLSIVSKGQTTLFQFNFEGNSANPNINNTAGAVTGTVSGVNNLGFASVNACGTGNSNVIRGDNWTQNDFYEIKLNTTGFNNMMFSFCSSTSDIDIREFDIRYNIGGGIIQIPSSSFNPTTSGGIYSFNLPAVVNNRSNVSIYIYKTVNANNSNRILYLDNVTLVGYRLPTISSFTPNNACAASGASVIITGTNFSGATAVNFNGVAASYTVNSNTQITAQLPATATSGAITVTTPGGTATSSSSFTVNAVAGNQTSYGANSWIGYVYASTNGGNPPSNAFTTSYVGYITQPESFDLNLVDAALSGANLCSTYADNFAIRFKMNKNMPAGNYTFNVGGDDGYRLSLDGGATYAITNWNTHAYQNTTQTFYLSGNTNFVLEYFENTGQSRVQFSYTFCPVYSITGASAVSTACTTAKSSIVTLNSTVSGLPVGNYTVSYTLSYNGNSTVYTAPMTVSSAGTGQFTASLAPMGANNSTTITITNLASGSCSSVISSSNTTNTVNVYAPITPVAAAGFASCSTWNAQWNNDTFVNGYFLDVATTNTFTAGSYLSGFQDLNVGNVITYPITGLTPGMTYYYRVRNNNLGCGVSVNSNVISFIAGGAVAPTIGAITQPTCTTNTGNFNISNYNSSYSYTITPSTGVSRSGSLVTAPAGNYTISTTYSGCTSLNTNFTINPQSSGLSAPMVGTITQPSCATASGSVVLNGLPSGSWLLTRTPGNVTTTGTGTSTNISGLSAGTYTYSASSFTNGLKGEYYNNKNLSGAPVLTRTDATVNFDWVNGSPDPLINNDDFSVRWTGQIQPLYSQNYTFTTRSDDGIRLWVNGTQIINNWTDHGATNNTGTITLTAGLKYDIVLEYYESGGQAVSQLSWNSTSQALQIIPQSQLFSVLTCSSPTSANVVINAQPTAITITSNKVNETCSSSNNGSISPILSGGLTNIRYIKLTQKYASWQQVQEIQAFEIFSGTNVALSSTGSIATASSIYSNDPGTFGPAKVNDGNAIGYSFWHSNSTNINEWVQVDLQSGKNIDYLRIYNRSDCCQERGQNMLLELFDGSNNLVYSKTINLWENINGPHYIDVNILDLSWADGATTLNRTGLDSGAYTLNYADAVGCSVSLPIVIGATAIAPVAPVPAAPIHPTCVVSTGSVILSGLPSSGAWTIIASPTAGLTGLTGTGATATVGGLVAGTTYTFSVSNGTCTSPISANVSINPLPLVATYNGTWTNGPPTIQQSIVFSGNYTSTGNLEGCDCTVNAGVKVTVKSNHALKITNAVKVNTAAGTSLTFQNNASLIQVNDAAVNTGNIIYERETTPIKRFDYTYWSSPVLNQKLIDVSPETDYDKFYSFDAASDNWSTADPQAFMQRGIGYIIRAPEGTNAPPSPLSTYPASFIGVPFNGAFTIPGIIQDRSYLLGNPYPSALDADKFLTANSSVLDGTLYFWTHTTNIGIGVSNPGSGVYAYSSDDYATYNLTGGVGTGVGNTINNVEQTINKPTGKIAAGQAFFTSSRLNPTGTVIDFNNSMRLDVNGAIMNNSQFFKVNNSTKKTNTIEKHRVWLNLTNKQGAFKQMLVGYLTGATNEYDSSFDGPTYNGNEFIDFYSISDGEFLAIQGRALPFDENDSVPLGYSSAIEGDFSISIDEVDGLLVGQNIYLEDKLNSSIHNLTKEACTFETSKGTFDDRFVLRYTDKTLGTGDFDTTNMQVLVSVKNKQIKINSSVESIDKVLIFDILGKQIFNKINVGTTELVIPNLGSSEQVLIVKTLLQNGQTVTTKLIY